MSLAIDGREVGLVQALSIGMHADSAVPVVFLKLIPGQLDIEFDTEAEVHVARAAFEGKLVAGLDGRIAAPGPKDLAAVAAAKAAYEQALAAVGLRLVTTDAPLPPVTEDLLRAARAVSGKCAPPADRVPVPGRVFTPAELLAKFDRQCAENPIGPVTTAGRVDTGSAPPPTPEPPSPQ